MAFHTNPNFLRHSLKIILTFIESFLPQAGGLLYNDSALFIEAVSVQRGVWDSQGHFKSPSKNTA